MNKRQNLSKFFYDIAKLSYAGLGITAIIGKERINLLLMIAGIILTAIFVIIGYKLDKGE